MKENPWILRIGVIGRCQKVPNFKLQIQFFFVKNHPYCLQAFNYVPEKSMITYDWSLSTSNIQYILLDSVKYLGNADKKQ